MSNLDGTRKFLFSNITKPLNDFVMENRKKIEAMQEKDRIDFNDLAQRIDNLKIYPLSSLRMKIEAMESALLKMFNAFSQKYADGWSEDTLYDKLIGIEYDLKKELEGTTKYYDEKTLTHFISDIEDWIKTNKHEEFDGTSYWCVDVPGLEQFLIDKKKQMMRYNKTKTKKQLEGKQ